MRTKLVFLLIILTLLAACGSRATTNTHTAASHRDFQPDRQPDRNYTACHPGSAGRYGAGR